MTTQKKLLTLDDLMAMPDDGKRYELIRGALIEMPPPGIMHTVVTDQIGWQIGSFVRQNNLPFVGGPEAAAYIERGPDTVRAADYAIIFLERITEPLPERGYVFGVVPDLVVEVVSPDYWAEVVDAKTQAWLDAGARLVLVAYIGAREVIAHHDDGSVVRYGIDDTVGWRPGAARIHLPGGRYFCLWPAPALEENGNDHPKKARDCR